MLKSIKSPRFFQKLQWIADPVGYMEAQARENKDIFMTSALGGGAPIAFVNHPDGIQQLLTQDNRQFDAPGEVNAILQPLLGDYSVILVSGDRHTRQRKLLMPPFHGERMRAYGQLICDTTDKVMGELTPGQPFRARAMMQKISLHIILKAVFGIAEGERYEQIEQEISQLLELFRSPISSSILFFDFLRRDFGAWSPGGYFRRQQDKIDQLLYAEIAQRRQTPDLERSDILSLLMSARDEEGQAMSDRELRDELLTLLFAGHETTATAMAWSLYWVHSHPEIAQKLREEIESLGKPEPTEIFRLPYLTAVCNETLRIYPVAMLTFPRVVREPVQILGHHLEPNTGVVGCIYLAHHREDIYPNSKQFRPERFLERQFSAYEFLPFGGGVRRCVGAALAQYEMKLALATIVSNYSLSLQETKPVLPQRRGVTLSPAGGVRMKMEGKREPSYALGELVTQQ